ncbi:sodium/calcium exchanger NCL2-like isoform X3 [Salvia miltiorrhiza]|uniref:sodium/calcium exchanger NCL2-like isoform X3 n=1 Tax=Salvia miltiorrhiza TaxID=226208 RepID=UPI0025ABA4E0|nr:sodium/calcium exchanger NCL2-like isoform X3 [Salvia miltiorrhiza]
MKRFVVVSSLLLLASHLAYSRSIADEGKSVSDGSFLQWPLSATTVTCEPVYGFLPCTSNGWGLLFMIVVYNILLSIGGQYVGAASDLWLQIIGPGVVGGSVFQFLGTIPQLVMMLLPILTGSTEEAQLRATSGMGMVFGGVAILLTLIWGLTVVLGSYDPSEDDETDTSEAHKAATANGSSIVTDVETGWTARLVLVASVPYLILELQNAVTSSSGKRVLILIALIVTVALLCGYVLYQSFQPWIQSRCFEFMVDKYAKDKLLKLITANGRPNTKKIQGLFNKIDKDNNASVTAAEVRVLVLGVQMDDNDTSTDLVLDEITTYFDTSGDGGISQDEFVKGMTKLAFTLLDQTPTQITKVGNNSSQITSPDQEALLGSITSTSQTISNTWSIYFRATFFLVFGIAIACTLSSPLMKSIMEFATAVNVSSFWVSYLVLPLALNYGKILETISLAAQKSQRTNSLMLSSLYSGVFMGNIIGLLPFLVPVYFRNLSSDVSAELHLVLLLCIFMGTYTSFNTTFPRWTGYVALILYPISLATVYVITSVL